jgi:protein-tyrosine phosphatase
LTVVHAYPDGTTLSGASRYELNRYGVDLLIDCGVDVSNNGFVKGCPAGFEKLKSFGVVPNVLKLDWPDRGAPPVGLDFWRELRRLFQGGWNVVACCLGGHGRTGTCLAALLIEDGMSAKDAIGQVRTVHCVDAVESKAQEMYLEWLGNEAAREGG